MTDNISPLPWKIIPFEGYDGNTRRDFYENVFDNNENLVFGIMFGYEGFTPNEANTKFIIEAVNSHHELKANLAAKEQEVERLREALKEKIELLACWKHGYGSEGYFDFKSQQSKALNLEEKQ